MSKGWGGRSESGVWRPQSVRGGEAALSQGWGGRSESEVGRPHQTSAPAVGAAANVSRTLRGPWHLQLFVCDASCVDY